VPKHEHEAYKHGAMDNVGAIDGFQFGTTKEWRILEGSKEWRSSTFECVKRCVLVFYKSGSKVENHLGSGRTRPRGSESNSASKRMAL
jgi:hypothetical protein